MPMAAAKKRVNRPSMMQTAPIVSRNQKHIGEGHRRLDPAPGEAVGRQGLVVAREALAS